VASYAISSANPPDDFGMVVQLKSASARTITWGSNYASRLETLPTAPFSNHF